MIRKGIDLIALFYLATALICFVPYFQFDHPILIAAGLVYAIPLSIIAGGVALKREWGRKLAIILSSLLVVVVLPLLFKKELSFIFAFPFSIAVTYPRTAVRSFRGLFGILLTGHLLAIISLLQRSVKGEFQPGSAGEAAPREEKGEVDLNARNEGGDG